MFRLKFIPLRVDTNNPTEVADKSIEKGELVADPLTFSLGICDPDTGKIKFEQSIASANKLGRVRVGKSLKISEDGILDVDTAGLSASAAKLTTPVDIEMEGDVVGKVNTDFSKSVLFALTISDTAKASLVAAAVKAVDLSTYAKKTDIPALPDLSTYAKKTDIPANADLSAYLTKTDAASLYAPKGSGGATTTAATSSVMTFTIAFNSDGTPSVAVPADLPSGWTYSVSNSTQVTISHTLNKMPTFISYLGLGGSGTKYRYRLPTAANEMFVNVGEEKTKFNFIVTASVTGADSGSTAKVNVSF